jgi:serine/threonine protein kinase
MSTSTSLPGARIGKYRIVAHIATGGMGTVYKARDEELQRTVALKVLSPDLANNPILVERFRREAIHAARLTHKNIVTLFECGQVDGLHYIAMEYIEGIDLSEYIRRKEKLDPEEARRILIQACKALEHAYAQGITHRDIKPSNFLLANDEGRCRVKLTDLGLARMVNEDDFRVTRAGTTVGTVDYMAPEQARDSSLADIRSDIYGLGCTCYHMLAGQPPFAEGGLGERIYKHIAADPPDIRDLNPEVSASLWTVLRRMLAKHPDDRFQTPTELIEALRSVDTSVAEGPEPDTLSDSDSGIVPSPLARPAEPPKSPVPVPPPPPPSPPEQREAPVVRHTPTRTRKRNTTVPELNTVSEIQPDALGVTPEQRSAAAGQFSHATEVIRNSGDSAYAQQLLMSCCKLDPANILYRKLLREVGREVAGRKKSSWFGSLTNLPARGRLRSARNAGDHRKVLEFGEELLSRLPGDVPAQIDMAESAEALGLMDLALWLLEEARRHAPDDHTVLRALALVYEQMKRFAKAIPIWEQIQEADPGNVEALAKIRELSVSDTLSRGRFRNEARPRDE